MRILLAIILFLPLSFLRIIGCFFAQRQETAGESIANTWNALFGGKDEKEVNEEEKG